MNIDKLVNESREHFGIVTPTRVDVGTVPNNTVERLEKLERLAKRSITLEGVSYLLEELQEFADAGFRGSTVDALDALGDIVYFAFGVAHMIGYQLEPIIEEIHRSNMTKDTMRIAGGPRGKGPNYVPPNISSVLKSISNLKHMSIPKGRTDADSQTSGS